MLVLVPPPPKKSSFYRLPNTEYESEMGKKIQFDPELKSHPFREPLFPLQTMTVKAHNWEERLFCPGSATCGLKKNKSFLLWKGFSEVKRTSCLDSALMDGYQLLEFVLAPEIFRTALP